MKALALVWLLHLRVGHAKDAGSDQSQQLDLGCTTCRVGAAGNPVLISHHWDQTKNAHGVEEDFSAVDLSGSRDLPPIQLASPSPPLPGKPLPNDPLRPFSVSQPLLSPSVFPPDSRQRCTQTLVAHTFAFSYGSPAVAPYAPPSHPDCGAVGSWARIILTLRVTSNGTQYDRLSSVYLHGVEIWRTSTPEPTAPGIDWIAEKDITRYTALLAHNGTIVLDLENFYDPGQGLTGMYDTILNITFVPPSGDFPTPLTADVILPLSLRKEDAQSIFRVPPSAVTLTSFPINAQNAFVEIYASGNALEEYWYGNIPDEYFSQLPPWDAPDGDPNPHGPFREVQLLIDGVLAGVIFPYPVIYSGQFLPTLWRPMMSHGSFDSPTYFIDITPFVPSLSDGKTHNFTLSVVGQEANRTINSDWILTGNIQLYLDPSDLPTRGNITTYSVEPFTTVLVTGTVNGTAPDVYVTTKATRNLTIEGELVTGSGFAVHSSWNQELNYQSNQAYQLLEGDVRTQRVKQNSWGHSWSSHETLIFVTDLFEYPLEVSLSFSRSPSEGNQTFYDYDVLLNQTYNRGLGAGPAGGMYQNFNVSQHGSGTQSRHQTNVTIRTGQLAEFFSYYDLKGDTYSREVEVATWANTTSGLGTVDVSSLLSNVEGGTLATTVATWAH